MSPHYYTTGQPFDLESGARLERLTVAYHTYGTRRGNNVIWVCHALTANSEVADWWPHTVESGKFLDPERYFIICANFLGSCYGTTGANSIDPATGKPYGSAFPLVTLRDMARVNLLLADHLQIDRVHAIVGGSVGGFQALEMALERPGFADRLGLIATGAKAQPWAIAADEAQRMALEAPCAQPSDPCARGALRGLEAARALGLLTYRGSLAFNATQQDPDPEKLSGFRACSYQRHQGAKLSARFDPHCYRTILDAFDSHNIGRGRGGIAAALRTIEAPTLLIAITSDIILPIQESLHLYRHLPHAQLELLASSFGHDGFLVEHQQLDDLLQPFLND